MTADETTPDETGRAALGAEERARLRAVAEAATPGPWHWSGNTKTRSLDLSTWISGWGRCTVMGFRRWGTQSAKPMFADENHMLVDGDELVEWEVCKAATDPSDLRLYRHDVSDIRHPDAQHIATFDPPTALALLDAADERDRLAAKVERLREAARYSVQASIHVDRPTEVRIEREGVVLVDGMMADGLDATLVRRLTSERDAARAESAALRETVERLRTEVETPSAAVTQLQQAVHRRTEQRDAARAEAQALRETLAEVWSLADLAGGTRSVVRVDDLRGIFDRAALVADGDAGEGGCHCPPCPGRGNDGHGMTHCAECCFGSGVEVEPGCPVHNPLSAGEGGGRAS